MPSRAKAKSPVISKQPSQVIREPSPLPMVTPTVPESQVTDLIFEEDTVGLGNQSMPPQVPASLMPE